LAGNALCGVVVVWRSAGGSAGESRGIEVVCCVRAGDTVEGRGGVAGAALLLAEEALSVVRVVVGVDGLAVAVAVVKVEEVPASAGCAVGRVDARQARRAAERTR
jgi:hypothetical protein